MLTPEFVALLWIALGVNVFVFVGALVVPRIRARLDRRQQARAWALRAIAGPRRPDPVDVDADAGQPWFPAAAPAAAAAAAPAANAGDDATANRAPSPMVQPGRDVSEPASASAWMTLLDDETARAARYHRPASVVLIELTGFERLADRIGSAGAERLIPPLATTIQRHARATDRIAQLGPTRFGVLLVETDEVSAINYIERVRGACDLWLAAGAVALRLSIGWSEIRGDRTAQAVWVEAEQRLFAERRRAGLPEAAARADLDGLVSALQPTGS